MINCKNDPLQVLTGEMRRFLDQLHKRQREAEKRINRQVVASVLLSGILRTLDGFIAMFTQFNIQ